MISNIPQASSAGSSSSDGYPSSVSGSVVTNNCLIRNGDYQCYSNSLFTWSGVGTFAVANARNGVYYEGITGDSPQLKSIRIYYGANTVSLLGSIDGGGYSTIYGPVTVYGSCMSGLGWVGGLCVPGLGTITASNCLITSGNSSCSTTINWSTQQTETAAVFSSNRSLNQQLNYNLISNSLSGNTTRSIGYGSDYNFNLYINGVYSTYARPTASCIAGTTWNGSICAPSNPTIEVFANSVRPKYTTTSPANIELKWTAYNFPNNARVTCKLVTLVNGSPVSTVKGLSHSILRYPETGYLNPTAANTTYRVTCSDEIQTWMDSPGCTIYNPGEFSCTSEVNWDLTDANSVLGDYDLEVWSLSSMLSNNTSDGDYVTTYAEDTYHSADGSTNDVRMFIKTGSSPTHILFDTLRPIATCNPATLTHIPGMQQCITWAQYDSYLTCKFNNCSGDNEACFNLCTPYRQI